MEAACRTSRTDEFEPGARWNHIFKARGRDKSHPRAFTFQQDIRSNCGAMADKWSAAFCHRVDHLQYGPPRVFWRGKHFQHLHGRFFDVDTISESAARIDRNVHWFAPSASTLSEEHL